MNTLTPTLFDNTAKAFARLSNKRLRNARFLFGVMNSGFLVKILSKLTLLAVRMNLPVKRIIKSTIFQQFCGGENINESLVVADQLHHNKVGAILDYSVEGKETDLDFERTKCEIMKIIFKAKDNPAIPYTSVKLTGIGSASLLEEMSSSKDWQGNEESEKMLTRIESICQCANDNNVPVYFDAEESWIQPAIDMLAEKFMWRYNERKAIVLTTVQMYRTDRLEYLKRIIQKGHELNRRVGVKLVRGAYWEKENRRAAVEGKVSPVHQLRPDTDRDFDLAVRLCIDNIDIVTLCAGTHNLQSTCFLIDYMKEKGLPNNHPNIYFSQLYGMSDNITYNLADKGYNVTKYLPYGPVKSVIPYLIRRAEENTAIAGQMGRELSLISAELKRRDDVRLLR